MTDPIPGSPPTPPTRRRPRPPEPRRSRRHTVVAVALSTVGVLLAVVAVAGFLIHLPYVIISPGSATPLDSSVVQVDGAETYPHDGDVLFLTVRVSTHDPNVWRVVTVVARSRPRRRGARERGGVPERRAELGVQHRADGPVAERRQVRRARPVSGTRCRPTPRRSGSSRCAGDAPAYGKLEPGDQVLAVDGTAVADVQRGRLPGAGAPPGRRRRRHLRPQRHDQHRDGGCGQGVEGPAVVRRRRRGRPGARRVWGSRRRSSPPINSRST